MGKAIYCISGLGADEGTFRYLNLGQIHLIHVPWISPDPKQSVASYAKKMIAEFTFEDNCCILGLSFGGMVAVEISKLIPVDKLILISSMSTAKELPFRFRLAGKLGLHKWLPIGLMRSANFITYFLFGVKSREHKRELKQILHATDSYFMRWALGAIISWKNEETPNMIQIHGSKDRILNLPRNPSTRVIQGGGHLMIMNFPEEVSAHLIEEFSDLDSID